MKVVLFCGGQGLRIRDYSQTIPKPMVPLGPRPILCHLMRYYAHFGHRDFILCLGYKGNVIREYFLNYEDGLANILGLPDGDRSPKLLPCDSGGWTITFAETGENDNIGQRLKAVQSYLKGEDMFLANYADGLTDLNLPDLVEFSRRQQAVASFLCVRPRQSFHRVVVGPDGQVNQIEPMYLSDNWVNGGYFVLHREIFDYLLEGEDLVEMPFQRLITEGRLSAMKYEGFWGCMDTYKEKQMLEDIYSRGKAPWEVWRREV